MSMFVDGNFISSFVKNSSKIWEGRLYTRNDGIRVVLNENTGTWRKLADLEHIKLIEKLGELESFNDAAKSVIDEVDNFDSEKAAEFAKNPSNLKSLSTAIETQFGMKPEQGDGTKEIEGLFQQKAAQGAAHENESAGDAKAQEAAIEEIENFKDEIKESLGKLHPILQPHLSDKVLFRERLFLEQDLRQLARESQEAEIEYEDDDYLDIPPEQKREILDKAKSLIDENVEDLADELKSRYELSDEDAEEYAIYAMEAYLSETEVEPKACLIPDDLTEFVENDFEETIDKFDGPQDELLDHLVDEYEIDPGEAEVIYEEKGGKISECIWAFVDVVKNRLQEKKDHIIKKMPNLSDEDKEKLIIIFNKRPDLENKFNWNNKSASIEDFAEIIETASKKSDTQEKKEAKASGDLRYYLKGKEDDLEIVLEKPDRLYALVKTYEGAKYADSAQCNKQPAKWCIGYEKDDKFWKTYRRGGSSFFLTLFKEPIKEARKTMVQIRLVSDEETGISVREQKTWTPEDHPKELKYYDIDKDLDELIEIIKEKDATQIKKPVNLKKRFTGQLMDIEEARTFIINQFNEAIETNRIIIASKKSGYNKTGEYITSCKLLKKVGKSNFIIKLRPAVNQIYCKLQSGLFIKINDSGFIDEFPNYGINSESIYHKDNKSAPSENLEAWIDENANEYSPLVFINEHFDTFKLPEENIDLTFINCEVNNFIICDTSPVREQVNVNTVGSFIINNLSCDINQEQLKKKGECAYKKYIEEFDIVITRNNEEYEDIYYKKPFHAVIFDSNVIIKNDNCTDENAYAIKGKQSLTEQQQFEQIYIKSKLNENTKSMALAMDPSKKLYDINGHDQSGGFTHGQFFCDYFTDDLMAAGWEGVDVGGFNRADIDDESLFIFMYKKGWMRIRVYDSMVFIDLERLNNRTEGIIEDFIALLLGDANKKFEVEFGDDNLNEQLRRTISHSTQVSISEYSNLKYRTITMSAGDITRMKLFDKDYCENKTTGRGNYTVETPESYKKKKQDQEDVEIEEWKESKRKEKEEGSKIGVQILDDYYEDDDTRAIFRKPGEYLDSKGKLKKSFESQLRYFLEPRNYYASKEQEKADKERRKTIYYRYKGNDYSQEQIPELISFIKQEIKKGEIEPI